MAVMTMKVALFSFAGDALGISKVVKFAMVHRISVVNASMLVSERSTMTLNFSFVRLLTVSLLALLYFSLLIIPNLHRKEWGSSQIFYSIKSGSNDCSSNDRNTIYSIYILSFSCPYSVCMQPQIYLFSFLFL